MDELKYIKDRLKGEYGVTEDELQNISDEELMEYHSQFYSKYFSEKYIDKIVFEKLAEWIEDNQ